METGLIGAKLSGGGEGRGLIEREGKFPLNTGSIFAEKNMKKSLSSTESASF